MPDPGNPLASMYPSFQQQQPTNALMQDPIGTYRNILAAQGQQIANAQGQFQLASGQNSYVNSAIGTLAAKNGVTGDDVRSLMTNIARNTNLPSSTINGVLDGMPAEGGAALQSYLTSLGNASIGSGGLAQRVSGPLSPAGQQTQTSLGQTTYAPSFATGLQPGAEAAANVASTGSANQGLALASAADGAPVRKAMLGNLESDLQNFTAGPGASWTNVAKAWANRNVLPQGFQFDPKSIASQEAFNKQAEQLAQQQFAAIGGTGTDAKFGSAFKSNPNDALSQLGNQGIIQLLKGNEDAITAKNRAWQQFQQVHGPGSYGAFTNSFNQTFDPRVYQSQYLSQPDFMKMVRSMSPQEQASFRSNLSVATGRGYAGAPGSSYGGQ